MYYDLPSMDLWHQELAAVIDGQLWEIRSDTLGGININR